MADEPGATLVVEKGLAGETEILIDRAVCLMGSATESDIVVENPYVSRLHARIVRVEQQFEIRDLGSKNGTFVNGSRLGKDGHVLHTGDRIELARGQVILRFRESGGTLTLQTGDLSEKGEVEVDAGSRDVWIRA